MDHIGIKPGVSDALVIWNNQTPPYHNGVARDAGIYKTIGVSFEFGGIPATCRPAAITTLTKRQI